MELQAAQLGHFHLRLSPTCLLAPRRQPHLSPHVAALCRHLPETLAPGRSLSLMGGDGVLKLGLQGLQLGSRGTDGFLGGAATLSRVSGCSAWAHGGSHTRPGATQVASSGCTGGWGPALGRGPQVRAFMQTDLVPVSLMLGHKGSRWGQVGTEAPEKHSPWGGAGPGPCPHAFPCQGRVGSRGPVWDPRTNSFPS